MVCDSSFRNAQNLRHFRIGPPISVHGKNRYTLVIGEGPQALKEILARFNRSNRFHRKFAFAPRLHFGVFAGIALTMVSFLYRRTHPRIMEVGEHPDGTLRDRNRFDLAPLAPDVPAVAAGSRGDAAVPVPVPVPVLASMKEGGGLSLLPAVRSGVIATIVVVLPAALAAR